MTREEIEQAIKNGESVWLVFEDRIYKLDRSKIIDINDCCVEYYNNYYKCNLYATISDFYETEARAKHFISHCGVTRTETLPFLTWEEFKRRRNMMFQGKDEKEYILKKDIIWNDDIDKTVDCLKIVNETDYEIIKYFDYTEANFYKAYDECVRLFRDGD